MKLYHSARTAPQVGDHPYYGEFVFFSGFAQTERGDRLFSVEVEGNQIIDVEDLIGYEIDGNLRPLVAELKSLIKRRHDIDISDDLAEDMIAQRVGYESGEFIDHTFDRDDFDSYSEYREMLQHEKSNFEADAEDGWRIQLMGARAAKVAGFRGIHLSDEMGRSICIDMDGRDAEFVEIVGEDA